MYSKIASYLKINLWGFMYRRFAWCFVYLKLCSNIKLHHFELIFQKSLNLCLCSDHYSGNELLQMPIIIKNIAKCVVLILNYCIGIFSGVKYNSFVMEVWLFLMIIYAVVILIMFFCLWSVINLQLKCLCWERICLFMFFRENYYV